MHELSIAQALVDQLERMAAKEKATRIVRASIKIGTFSGVDPEALKMAFPIATEGTIADGADLAVAVIPAKIVCRSCARESDSTLPFPVCEKCGSSEVECVAGRELIVQSVEINVPDPGN